MRNDGKCKEQNESWNLNGIVHNLKHKVGNLFAEAYLRNNLNNQTDMKKVIFYNSMLQACP